MTDLHHSEAGVRRQRTGGTSRRAAATPESRGTRTRSGHRASTSLELGSGPVSVQVRIGERWIAGQALTRRADAAGHGEVLVSHHGHLVWVAQHDVRVP
ncbi:MAG TPA: hypothetical protein VFT31_06470 [Kribbella sp.]|nr:hypothetical protein [Kribbella sp.]